MSSKPTLNDLIQGLAMRAMHQGESCVFANHVGGPPAGPSSTFLASPTLLDFAVEPIRLA